MTKITDSIDRVNTAVLELRDKVHTQNGRINTLEALLGKTSKPRRP